ncbi:hypothetical protein LUZ60_011546 [Juncus effusus]|nr:hypothetical protein LUZ60_011546 [Juncus effusus]
MGSEGQQDYIYSNGLYYQTGTNYFGYDPNIGLSLTPGIQATPKWDEVQNIWSYDVQDLHHSGMGLQQEYIYQQEYLYPAAQSYDSYHQPYPNYTLQTENSIPAQSYLSNQNFQHQHQHQLVIPAELGSIANPVYQPGAIETLNYANYLSSLQRDNNNNSKSQKGAVQNLVQVRQSGMTAKGVLSAAPNSLNLIPNSSSSIKSSSPLLSKPTGPLQFPPSSRTSNWTSPVATRSSKPSLPKLLAVQSYSSKLPVGSPNSEITINTEHFNRAEFRTEYDCAKFFVIKSYSEDDVHRSIKYGVWSSTPNGNRKLSVAYEDAQRKKCPVFLLFSVNGSGHFCGVAEMVGHVDFSKDVDLWQQDKWPGSFPVRWHILKDVPNTTLRQVALENNEFKPVTHSRDTQEVSLVPGTAILKIFKNSNARESVLDDFLKYEEQERSLHKRRTRLLSSDAPVFVPVSKKPEEKSQEINPNPSSEGNPSLGGVEVVGSGLVPEGNPNLNPSFGEKEVVGSGLVPEGNPNSKTNPSLVGEKEMKDGKKDLKKQEDVMVVKANGNGNPNPNLVGKEQAGKKENGAVVKANGNPNPNSSPNKSVVKKEAAEKFVVKKKDEKQENGTVVKVSINEGNPNPNFGGKEAVKKQVNGNGAVYKAKNKSEVKENGKSDPIESTAEKIGSLSISSNINKETGGSSSKKGQGDVVTIGSMHVRVNNNNNNP